jgi:cytidine deaminase
MTVTPDNLVAAAREAAKNAYAPYSKFFVGAAILLTDGRVVTGANFENASFGLSLCAETVALAKVANDGRLADVVAVAVSGGTGSNPVRPCGRCRQVLNEAAQIGGRDIVVHCSSGDGTATERHKLSDLIPHAFGPKDLA